MRPATKIVQGSQGGNRDADPLTTPIYETTTFIFEDAAEVQAYNEGRTAKFLYSRYGNPTVVAVEKTLASLAGRLPAGELASSRERLVRQTLRRKLGLPVLSLFSPEAQGA